MFKQATCPSCRQALPAKQELPPINAAIRYMLIRSGMKASELSKRSGISKGFISSLLNGDRNPSFETLALLAHAMGMNPSDICLKSESMAMESHNREFDRQVP